MQSIILSLIGNTQRVRANCPWCRGKNTLSINKDLGVIKYNCFKASCNIRGVIDNGRTISDSRERLGRLREVFCRGQSMPTIQESTWKCPEYFIPLSADVKGFEYLTRFDCDKAYWQQRELVCFDPKLRRIVFLVKRHGTIIDAVGRRLTMGIQNTPKWHRYGNSGFPFVANCVEAKREKDTSGENVSGSARDRQSILIVEDAISALKASTIINSLALMGTHLTKGALSTISEYDTAYLALDPDAAKKSLKLAAVIGNFTNVKVRFISDDLKYLSEDDIVKELKL